ncbi:MAG TPA: sulfatase-like hydrolase/transferase [Planctomycetota bacterium]|nr:sulfatase-like hydrolase/transferase [Planctomycetota bacterium]
MANTARKIVLIMTDTQPIEMVGCYNGGSSHPLKTPNIDRLAGEGVLFERAYCCQPVCGPARAALFTGTYPHSNGSWANTLPMYEDTKTIGQRLRDNGDRGGRGDHSGRIHTAYIGKWHLDGGDYFGYGRCPDGWDPSYWYDMRCYLEELSDADRLRSRKYETCLEPGFSAEFTYGRRCTNRALDFLQKHHEEDFFLVVSYDEPHGPCLCPAPFNRMYADHRHPVKANVHDNLACKPSHVRRWSLAHHAGWERARADGFVKGQGFFGCNTFVDDEIGRVLAGVDRFAPDALVIYTSDHGHSFFNHGITSKGPAMYEEITRIPLIVRWPGITRAGATHSGPVSHIDVLPTIMEAAGLDRPPILEGTSLAPELHSPENPTGRPVFIEFTRFEIDHDGMLGFIPIRCIVDGRWKLVVNLLSTDELYDLESDPGELTNLIVSAEQAAVRNRLHERLLDWMNDTRDPFRGYVWDQRPWRADGLDKGGMTRQRPPDGYLPWQLDYDTGLPISELARNKGKI